MVVLFLVEDFSSKKDKIQVYCSIMTKEKIFADKMQQAFQVFHWFFLRLLIIFCLETAVIYTTIKFPLISNIKTLQT